MPLKAKILNPAMAGQAATISTSTSPPIPKEQPTDDPDDVLFNTVYNVRTIELNRPKKLNSLNASMARKIIPRLLEWQKSQLASIIIIGGAGGKAFCAGGDVAALAQQNTSHGAEGREASHAYFGLEYQLDHLIATYPKPYIAYMDGISMGGGVGLSVHAPIRIATERTVFAMPETTIGFFPDVGGSFFLPRLEGYIGTYLALTSERLMGVNAFYAGIATHYIDSATLPSLTSRLAELEFKDYEDMHSRLATINATIAEFDSGLPHNEPMLLAGSLRSAIDRCFSPNSVEEIISTLEHETKSSDNPAEIKTWATKTLKTLSERSPTSLKVTLMALREGRNWNIAEAFQREYIIAGHFMSHPDFQSGVSARLIHKPASTPVWSPPKLSDIGEESVRAFFKAPEGQQGIPLFGEEMGKRPYKEYPFRMGLVREEEIEELVRQGGWKGNTLVRKFQDESGGRRGVREKVEEVVGRCCGVGGDGELFWRG
ncbi:3-hydroxyisobutyryl-CoA hydrolase [Lecanora helva]